MGLDTEPLSVAAQLAAYTGTDQTLPVWATPQKVRITGVDLIAATTVTGHTTDNATLNVINKGTNGAGSTVVASKAFTSGVNAAAFDRTAVTLSTTKANLEIAADSVLAVQWVEGGTGVDLPASALVIQYAVGYGGGI